MKKEIFLFVLLSFLLAGCVSQTSDQYGRGIVNIKKIGINPQTAFRCIPKTCQSMDIYCDQANDGCGKIINCGVCSGGTTCWMGKCRLPGRCAIDLNCGLNAPVGKPYCQGQDIYQDIVVYGCSPELMYTFTPGSVCLNKTQKTYLFTCPSGTSCQGGLCFKQCTQDTDCSTRDRTRDGVYINLPCSNGFCPLWTAEDMTTYDYCIDSDRTLPYQDIHDPSYRMPGYVLRLSANSQMPVQYLFDDLDQLSTGNLREWACQSRTSGDYKEDELINCSRVLPSFSGRLFRTGVSNQYLPYNVNVGFCG